MAPPNLNTNQPNSNSKTSVSSQLGTPPPASTKTVIYTYGAQTTKPLPLKYPTNPTLMCVSAVTSCSCRICKDISCRKIQLIKMCLPMSKGWKRTKGTICVWDRISLLSLVDRLRRLWVRGRTVLSRVLIRRGWTKKRKSKELTKNRLSIQLKREREANLRKKKENKTCVLLSRTWNN